MKFSMKKEVLNKILLMIVMLLILVGLEFTIVFSQLSSDKKEIAIQIASFEQRVYFENTWDSITMNKNMNTAFSVFQNKVKAQIPSGGEAIPMQLGDYSGEFNTALFTNFTGQWLSDTVETIILTSSSAKKLFKTADAVGNEVSIDGKLFTVVGVVDKFRSASFSKLDGIRYLNNSGHYNNLEDMKESNISNVGFVSISGKSLFISHLEQQVLSQISIEPEQITVSTHTECKIFYGLRLLQCLAAFGVVIIIRALIKYKM